MWRLRNMLRPRADVPALEAQVQRAGIALACSYSTSDEYEAAVIAERREAGAYGARSYRHIMIAAAALSIAVLLLYILGS